MTVKNPIGGAARVRRLNEHGAFDPPAPARWDAGPGLDFDPSGTAEFWMTPGLVDAHAHLAWHAFDAEDRARLSEVETRAGTAAALARNLAAGFTAVRDAGGLSPKDLAELEAAGPSPRVQCSVRMLDRAAADAAGGLDRAVDSVLADGAQWVKLVATASVASPAGAGLEPVFTAAEVHDAVRRAGSAGARVMVHAWGGAAIDDAIEAGAASIEHGIFLTDAQAQRAAERGLTLVPTVRIYRQVQQMIVQGALPAAFRVRVDEAVGAHPRAVLRARDAGLPIAVGTDSGAPDQHGTGAGEIAALVSAGLTPGEALVAATYGGARLLAGPSGSDAPDAPVVSFAHDAVVFDRDPREPGVLGDPDRIVAVLLDDRAVDLSPLPLSQTPDPVTQ